MRRVLLLAVLAAVSVTGCRSGGLFASRQRDQDRSSRVPDPLLSSDLEEQQKWGRARYSLPEADRTITPITLSERPTPSGR